MPSDTSPNKIAKYKGGLFSNHRGNAILKMIESAQDVGAKEWIKKVTEKIYLIMKVLRNEF